MPTFVVDFSSDSRVCTLKEHSSLFFLETKSVFAQTHQSCHLKIRKRLPICMVKHLRYFKKLASDCAFDLRLQSLRPREWASLPSSDRVGGGDFNQDFT